MPQDDFISPGEAFQERFGLALLQGLKALPVSQWPPWAREACQVAGRSSPDAMAEFLDRQARLCKIAA